MTMNHITPTEEAKPFLTNSGTVCKADDVFGRVKHEKTQPAICCPFVPRWASKQAPVTSSVTATHSPSNLPEE